MKTLILITSILAILDLGIIPMLLSSVRKTGGFHYLIATMHKLLFMVLVLVSGFLLFGSEAHGLLFQLAFCVALLFIFNATFEFNDYMLKNFEPEKYSLEGMTEEGKELMQFVFEDMRNQNKKSLTARFNEMINNFITNVKQDVSVFLMVLTDNKAMKDSYIDIHKMMGNDVKFGSMTNRELFFVVKTRVAVDVTVIAFAVLVLGNLV